MNSPIFPPNFLTRIAPAGVAAVVTVDDAEPAGLPAFPLKLRKRIEQAGVVAAVTVDEAELAVPLARALLEGGVEVMELTLRTPSAMEALRRITAEVPHMLAGAGTLLTPGQIEEVMAAGAAFGVAPGLNPRVVQAARQVGLPFAPGVMTPSDIEQALENGCRLLKFFPAEPGGGPCLKGMAQPYAHLDVRFIPMGGLEARHLETYLVEPIIAAVGGSWIAPRDWIRNQAWQRIRDAARQTTEIVRRIRKGRNP